MKKIHICLYLNCILFFAKLMPKGTMQDSLHYRAIRILFTHKQHQRVIAYSAGCNLANDLENKSEYQPDLWWKKYTFHLMRAYAYLEIQEAEKSFKEQIHAAEVLQIIFIRCLESFFMTQYRSSVIFIHVNRLDAWLECGYVYTNFSFLRSRVEKIKDQEYIKKIRETLAIVEMNAVVRP